MFRMCPSGKDRDLHVGKRRAGQYANVFFFFKMCENQSLPVPCKHVFTACGKKLTAAARFPRLDQKVYFCIMAKRFKVSHTFYRFCNGFFIYNTSGTKFHRYVKTVPDHFFQNLNLHFAHKLRMDFSELAVPENMKLRFFLLQLSQFLEHLMRITVIWKDDLIVQDRFQNRKF